MVILKCISKDLMNLPDVESNMYLEGGDARLHTHVMHIRVRGDRKSVSGKQCQVAQELGFNSLSQQEGNRAGGERLCSIPVRAQGNVRCESGKSVGHVFLGHQRSPTMEVFGGFSESETGRRGVKLVRLALCMS